MTRDESGLTFRSAAERPRADRGVCLGRGSNARERWDDPFAVDLEDPLLIAAHQIDVELANADRGELAELFDVLIDLAGHAKAVDRLVVNEGRVRRTGFGMVLVVVTRAVPHVGGEVGRKAL